MRKGVSHRNVACIFVCLERKQAVVMTAARISLIGSARNTANTLSEKQCGNRRINESHMGMGAILLLLLKYEGVATAGQNSEELDVSTARVAVLLKKMIAKGLLTKEKGITDGRVTIVRITESGEEIAIKMRNELWIQLEGIIDTIREERILEFIDIENEIKLIAKTPNFYF